MPALPTRRILGVDFFIGTLDAAVDQALLAPSSRLIAPSFELLASSSIAHGSSAHSSTLQSCTLIVAPSAPGLAVDLVRSEPYRRALQTADLALTDSGFMVLLWHLFTGEKLPRHSGLKFLRAVLARPEMKQPGAVFWVMPSAEESARNQAWLRSQGFPVTTDDIYIAPTYPATGGLSDPALVERIVNRRPRVMMLAIGGGVQERLGLTLRSELSALSSQLNSSSAQALPAHSSTSILCLGAAIAFLSGTQTSIPPWADKLMLGWLCRLLSNPCKFWRRYWDALRLVSLIWKYRKTSPNLAPSH